MTEKERRISDLEKAHDLLFDAINRIPENMTHPVFNFIEEAMQGIELEKLELK